MSTEEKAMMTIDEQIKFASDLRLAHRHGWGDCHAQMVHDAGALGEALGRIVPHHPPPSRVSVTERLRAINQRTDLEEARVRLRDVVACPRGQERDAINALHDALGCVIAHEEAKLKDAAAKSPHTVVHHNNTGNELAEAQAAFEKEVGTVRQVLGEELARLKVELLAYQGSLTNEKAASSAIAQRFGELRRSYIDQLPPNNPNGMTCNRCKLTWADGQPERHAPNCIARPAVRLSDATRS